MSLTLIFVQKKKFILNKSDFEITSGFSDRFGGDQDQTVAALDLGGGSTQITFVPTDKTTLDPTKSEFLHQISAFHRKLTVYTHR